MKVRDLIIIKATKLILSVRKNKQNQYSMKTFLLKSQQMLRVQRTAVQQRPGIG